MPRDVLLREHLDTMLPITPKQMETWTDRDPVLGRVRRCIEQGWPAQLQGEEFLSYWRRKDELSILEGCILWGSRVIIPPQGRGQLVEELQYLDQTDL